MDFFEPGYAHRGTAESSQAAERRRHDRFSDSPPLEVAGLPAQVHDVSRQGICLVLDRPVASGERYQLGLTDLLDGSSLIIEAEVIWCVRSRAGLRWVDLTDEQDRWLLQRFHAWLKALEGA